MVRAREAGPSQWASQVARFEGSEVVLVVEEGHAGLARLAETSASRAKPVWPSSATSTTSDPSNPGDPRSPLTRSDFSRPEHDASRRSMPPFARRRRARSPPPPLSLVVAAPPFGLPLSSLPSLSFLTLNFQKSKH
ncbi:hypothetical protein RJT34_17594 [Clitoria ternatea]|uniref:Uncharacterized protein n=1 Tax=Clitoria ternatea TaxID=43366 RepID=A0AAN9JAJ8_CLITE